MNAAAAEVARCLALISIAVAHPNSTPKELARLAGLTVKQVYRDLFRTAVLCGVPPYLPHQFVTSVLVGGRVRVAFADHFARPVSLTPLEAFALAGALAAVAMPDDARVTTLLAKIEATMPERIRVAWNRLRGVAPTRRSTDRLDTIAGIFRDAVRSRRLVAATYLPLGRLDAEPRSIGPLGLFEVGGARYVAGWDEVRKALRTYRLDRFDRAEATDRSFVRPPGFRLAHFAAAMRGAKVAGGKARIVVGPATARVLRERGESGGMRSRGQRTLWQPSFADPAAFAAFLLGLGTTDFVVEAPETLRAHVAESAAGARDAHAAGGPRGASSRD